ncbi:MAG: hypothetical protein NHB32_08825 [Fischerella sp. CENA71]|nr:hypothetical protein [Fischerella sp. CENA71]
MINCRVSHYLTSIRNYLTVHLTHIPHFNLKYKEITDKRKAENQVGGNPCLMSIANVRSHQRTIPPLKPTEYQMHC